MNIIEKEFSDIAIKRYNLFLFKMDDALDVIQRCKELKIWIFGIDSFIFKGQGIQPFMEFSPDYSYLNHKNNIWEIASNFIIEASKENEQFVFEIVYDL
ncbi:hypothetical protein RJI07_01655 [Mycoplasmatota bacterium WC30]